MLTDKRDDNGFCPIFIRSSINSQPFKYFTGEKCKPADWDIDRMKFKRSHEGWQHANERLSKLRSDLESAEHNFKLQRIIPTPQQLKDCIAPQSSKIENIVSYSIVDVYDRFLIDSANQGKKLGSIKALKTTRNHLAKFTIKKPIAIHEFTKAIYDKFIGWLMAQFDYQPNSIGSQTKNLITLFHWCEKQGGIVLPADYRQ